MSTVETARDLTPRVEWRAVTDFVTSSASWPGALIVEGEAGIGKTTFWQAACAEARDCGLRVLSTRPAAAETVLAYAGLADLLADVDSRVWAALPEPQRLAIDCILLRSTNDTVAADPRTVAAAFLAVLERLAEDHAVVVAIDDLQWLDSSSASVIGFAARRLCGPVGILAATRTGPAENSTSWLQLARPEAMQRIELLPMQLGALHNLVSRRLGRSIPRPTIVRIHDVSGGNPFYAIELARTVEDVTATDIRLPATLSELVAARLHGLHKGVRLLLLAAACLANPTVDLLVGALEIGVNEVNTLIEMAEAAGILVLSGHRVRFTHPLLSSGVYTEAPAPRRRGMHKRLAQIVDEPELRARHLALAATSADAATLESLDAAAEIARIRGAPAAAAELVDFAITLGGDTAQRGIQSATFHFNAGNAAKARTTLQQIIEGSPPAPQRAEAHNLLGLWSLLDGSSADAVELLERALADAGDDQALRGQILVALSFAQVNMRQLVNAGRNVEDAVTAARRLGQRHLLSVALTMRVLVHFLTGRGVEHRDLQQALELQDPHTPISALLSPIVLRAVMLLGTGQLDQARSELRATRQLYLERGEESELMMVAFHSGLGEIWKGDFAEATLIADDAVERAVQLDRDLPLAVGLMLRAAVGAYIGDEDHARRDAREALTVSERCDSPMLVSLWPVATLGFLDVSLGNYDAALSTLSPVLASLAQTPDATEIYVTPFVPDAVEAMVRTGRLSAAEQLTEIIEDNGRRLDRPWMLAVGGRCRGMLLAARGDVVGGVDALEAAMRHHDRLGMPFERARTQLELGSLRRRLRQKNAAAADIGSALNEFERLKTPLWAARARRELARVTVQSSGASLTTTERRVAELVADGLSNRAVASALLISPKTVGAHLANIYRKLDVHSRTELARWISNGER